jgi:hypothetical protein
MYVTKISANEPILLPPSHFMKIEDLYGAIPSLPGRSVFDYPAGPGSNSNTTNEEFARPQTLDMCILKAL